ncbi:hypothetical protein ACLM5J_19560 [Nocardioides sp. Bht2]|uniref:hypothetical protein n=1 Tax=Nocardioides sp. Bht2 TaxID=3392297 RepID=UPI0039B61684
MRSQPTSWFRLEGTEFSSRGWPPGTELLLDTRLRPKRGDVVVAQHGAALRVGVFGSEAGRLAVRNDLGSVWLSSARDVLGVVTIAEPPLHGMPLRPTRQRRSRNAGSGSPA